MISRGDNMRNFFFLPCWWCGYLESTFIYTLLPSYEPQRCWRFTVGFPFTWLLGHNEQ